MREKSRELLPVGVRNEIPVTIDCFADFLQRLNGMKKYVVKQIIGEGAYGVVMKCRHKLTNELVAIKKFKDSEDDSEARRTISRELTMLQKLKHQNIVGLRETFRRKGKLYMVFDFVEKNILQLLEENPDGIDISLVRSYTYQLVRAIHWCHENDVIHRDVKPENLLISSDNVLKLCDFGFARSIITSTAPYTDYVATRWYRAPELLLGGLYGPAIDIWSIGCIMGELADGKPVFPGDSEIDQLYVIQKVLGPLPDDLMDLFSNSPRFSGLKFPPIQQPLRSLSDRYSAKLDLEMIDFLKSVLNMSASQRPTAGVCQEHPAFRGLPLVVANGGDMEKTSLAKNSVSKTEKIETSEQHPSNLGLLTSDSIMGIADKKNKGGTETVACPPDNVNLDHKCNQSEASHQVIHGDAKSMGGDMPVDIRTSMRPQQMMQEAEKMVDDRGLVPLKKLKGKKPTQSNDLPCPVFADFNQKLAECSAIKGSDRRSTGFETGAIIASLPPAETRWGLNTVTSLQEGTEEGFTNTGVLTDAGKDNEIVQSFLPNPRSKYYQSRSSGVALRSGPTPLLLAADLGQNRTSSHTVLPPHRRGNEAEPLPIVFTESELAVGDSGRQRKPIGQPYLRGSSTTALVKQFGHTPVNLNQSYPPPKINLEKRKKHRPKGHGDDSAAVTRLPSDISPPSRLIAKPCDSKLLNCRDLTSPTAARRIPPLKPANPLSPALPPSSLLKRLEPKSHDVEQRQEFVLPETLFDNPGEKVRLKPLKMPTPVIDKSQRGVQLEQIQSRGKVPVTKLKNEEGILPSSVSGQSRSDNS